MNQCVKRILTCTNSQQQTNGYKTVHVYTIGLASDKIHYLEDYPTHNITAYTIGAWVRESSRDTPPNTSKDLNGLASTDDNTLTFDEFLQPKRDLGLAGLLTPVDWTASLLAEETLRCRLACYKFAVFFLRATPTRHGWGDGTKKNVKFCASLTVILDFLHVQKFNNFNDSYATNFELCRIRQLFLKEIKFSLWTTPSRCRRRTPQLKCNTKICTYDNMHTYIQTYIHSIEVKNATWKTEKNAIR